MIRRGEARAPVAKTIQAVLCLFAKPPIPGQVKTRLAATVGAELAADLARAFLIDTYSRLQQLDDVRVVLASTASLAQLPDGVTDATVWDQGEGDLGERLERVMRRALPDGPLAIALGADSPTLPTEALRQVVGLAAHDDDAVLGPTADGGFYALALRHVPQGLLADLPWSAPNTRVEVERRLVEHGFRVRLAQAWFDVDEVADLERLAVELHGHEELAAASAAVLRAAGFIAGF